MIPPTPKTVELCMMLEDLTDMYRMETTLLIMKYRKARTVREKRQILDQARRYGVINKIPDQVKHLDRLIHLTDEDCISNLRMDRNTFGKLCRILGERGGLTVGKVIGVEEQVAIFLEVLAHHKKNRIVRFDFKRSGATVCYYVHRVLGAILSLHSELLSKPNPVPNDCTDHRWRWFKVWIFCHYLFQAL